MNNSTFQVRQANPEEFETIGKLMVKVYSQLEGFPTAEDLPQYYKMLANIGELAIKPGVELLVAVNDSSEVSGAVVYFSDMKHYGAMIHPDQTIQAAGFRLLAVDEKFQRQGIGKLLVRACIQKAKADGFHYVIIHSTLAMKTAWSMYEKLGFNRSEELDFTHGALQIFGFKLKLD